MIVVTSEVAEFIKSMKREREKSAGREENPVPLQHEKLTEKNPTMETRQ